METKILLIMTIPIFAVLFFILVLIAIDRLRNQYKEMTQPRTVKTENQDVPVVWIDGNRCGACYRLLSDNETVVTHFRHKVTLCCECAFSAPKCMCHEVSRNECPMSTWMTIQNTEFEEWKRYED
jgi:hypothetical protein